MGLGKYGLGCGMSLFKYILFFFNFLIFLCGVGVLAIGVWLVADKSSAMSLLKVSEQATENSDIANLNSVTVLDQVAYILIATGSIVLLLGFFGCCGAAMESQMLLTVYVTLVMLIIAFEMGAAIYAGVSKDEFKLKLKELATNSLKYYKDEKATDALTLAWNYVFAEFECCGVNGVGDFLGSQWNTSRPPEQKLPTPCCILKDKSKFEPLYPNCPYLDYTYHYNVSNARKGCYRPVEAFFDDHIGLIVGITIGIALIQFCGVTFGCCICCALKQLRKGL